MQVLPSKELLPYIKHYLFLKSEGRGIRKLRLFSDGKSGMVFCLKDNLISTYVTGKSSQLPDSFLYGQISEFKDLYLMNEASFIIVVFQPDGMNRLLGIAAHEMKDKITPTGEMFGLKGLILYEKLLAQRGLQGKFYCLNAFFSKLIPKGSLSNHLLIQTSLIFIANNQGAITIQQLVKHTGYSERHIERAFGESIGLSPKKFGSIVKLHHFLKLLRNKSELDTLTGLSCEAGYSDQPHLIKDFRKYTGVTPKEYLQKTNRLAVNFMEFNTTVERQFL